MRKLNNLGMLVIFGVILIFASTSVFAGTMIPNNLAIDFRDPVWAGANDKVTYSVGDITVTASGRLPQSQTYKLYQKGTGSVPVPDGLGIATYNQEGEQVLQIDEINKNEHLIVTFGNGMFLTGAWITNLFDYRNTGDNFKQKEYGFMDIFGSDPANPMRIEFTAADGQVPVHTNGELWVDFGGSTLVTSVIFYPGSVAEHAPGNYNVDQKNEYSVAGFTVVPIPPSAILFASGIVGLIAVRRKSGWKV